MTEAFPRDVIGVEIERRKKPTLQKVLLINTNVVLAFDRHEICSTPGERRKTLTNIIPGP